MMFIFLIPLKSRESSKSWAVACDLLQKTLLSTLNQESKKFKIIVICNQVPDIKIAAANIFYLEINTPLYPNSHDLKQIDKSSKLLAGFEFAKQFNPDYIMAVDADDFVNSKIVTHTEQNQADGYYADRGYVYTPNPRLYIQENDFNRVCGTALITKTDLFESCFTNGIYCQFQGDNLKGHKLYPLPFYGAIYNRGHGENMDDDVPFDRSITTSLTKEIIQTFNFKEVCILSQS